MSEHEDVPPHLNALSGSIVDACWTVWSALGPGLLESAYQLALEEELRHRGHEVLAKHPVPFRYRSVQLARAYEIDLLVDDEVIVELKATEENHPVYAKQAITYLRLTGRRVAIVMNFGHPFFRAGLQRVVNNPRRA